MTLPFTHSTGTKFDFSGDLVKDKFREFRLALHIERANNQGGVLSTSAGAALLVSALPTSGTTVLQNSGTSLPISS